MVRFLPQISVYLLSTTEHPSKQPNHNDASGKALEGSTMHDGQRLAQQQ